MAEAGFFESWFLWRDALLAAVVGGALLAYLGFYIVLTRKAFVSAAVSQLAGLGVVIAWLLGAASEHAGEVVVSDVEGWVTAAVDVDTVDPSVPGEDPFAAPDGYVPADPFAADPVTAAVAAAATATATAGATATAAPGDESLAPDVSGAVDPFPSAATEGHELVDHGGPEESTDLLPLMLGILLGVLGVGLFVLPRRGVRASDDALLAITVLGASAVTLVLAGYLTQDYQHVQATLYGDAVVASTEELYLLWGVGVATLALHLFYRHRFLLIVFDPDAARAQGMATHRWGLFLGFTIGLSISVVTRGLGALPAFAFSVVPATAALLLTDRIARAFVLAVVIALVAAALGYWISFEVELPTGPTMVAVLLVALVPGAVKSALRRSA